MSKRPRTRKYSKQNPQQKRATVKPEAKAQYDPELMAQHYDKNSRAMLWGIFAVLAIIFLIYILIGIDVSGCSRIPDQNAYKYCRPYTLLEYLANPDVVHEEPVPIPGEEELEDEAEQEELDAATPAEAETKEE